MKFRPISVEVVGWVENPDTYPMAPKRHQMEYLREQAHLRARTNMVGAITRVPSLSSSGHPSFLP